MTALVVSVDAWVVWLAAWCFVIAKSLDHYATRRNSNNYWHAHYTAEADEHLKTRLKAIPQHHLVDVAVAWRHDPETHTDTLIQAVDALNSAEQGWEAGL